MGTFLGECPFPPLVEIREHPEFHDLTEMDKSSWASVFSLTWLVASSFWGEWELPFD